MKILIHEYAREVLETAATFLEVDLGQPGILYEIEDARLVNIALAIGGRKPRIEDPVGILRPEDYLMPEETTVNAPLPNPPHPSDGEGITVKLCEICNGPIIGRRRGAKTCSDACQKERVRRYQLEKRQEKLRVVGTQKEASAVVSSHPLSSHHARNPD